MKLECSACKRLVENHFMKVNAKGEIVCADCYYKTKNELRKFEYEQKDDKGESK